MTTNTLQTNEERNKFEKTLELYFNEPYPYAFYMFDIEKIKKYFEELTLTSPSLVEDEFNDETDNFVVDENLIKTTTDKSLHRENLVQTVVEFLPNIAYNLIDSISHDGLHFRFWNCSGDKEDEHNPIYILINNDSVPLHFFWRLEEHDSVIVILSPNIKNIRDEAFDDCYCNMTSIVIPNSVTSIGDRAFDRCSLPSIILPDSVTTIGGAAFHDCSMTSITLGNSVESIGHYAFRDCSKLKSIVIPDSVTYIGNGAFYNCGSLESIIMPDSITSFGNDVIRGCSSLKSLTLSTLVNQKRCYAEASMDSIQSLII
jgi:hypothetical protein